MKQNDSQFFIAEFFNSLLRPSALYWYEWNSRGIVDRVRSMGESGHMKTTLEIDDELYREAKAYASLTGRHMEDLVSEGLRLALPPTSHPIDKSAASKILAACFAEADKAMKSAPRAPTAREHLGEGRRRLE